MNIFEALTNFFERNKSSKDTPEGLCPNCWGRQEYGGQFYEAIKNENVDVNSMSTHKGWIQEYADKHLQGIQLIHEDDTLICQSCKLTYRPS